MLSRAAVAAVAVVPLSVMAASVHADGEKEERPRKIKISQLSIYGDPESPELEYVPPKDNAFREGISQTRQAVWGVMDKTQATVDNVKQKYETSKAHTNDLLQYIQEDSGMVARAGMITVAGLGGVVAGYRGGVMKKVLYCGAAMTGAAAVCYPRQAVDMTQTGWGEVSRQANVLWEQTKSSPQPHVEEPVKEEPSPPAPSEPSKDKTETIEPAAAVVVDESKLDHGMSKAEDKDMYTTRSG